MLKDKPDSSKKFKRPCYSTGSSKNPKIRSLDGLIPKPEPIVKDFEHFPGIRKDNKGNINFSARIVFEGDEEELTARLADDQLDSLSKYTAANHLAWLRRSRAGHKVNISALKLANVWLLNIPGEAFIEYQLAAQEMKPGDHVCTAAYEEYGPGYLCTEIAYSQGGYESSERVSRVSPEIEQVLLTAIGQVLE